MIYKHIVAAKNAIDEINKMRFPIQISYKLYKLKKKVDELFQFEVDLEKKCVDQYHGAIQQDGRITFQSKNDCSECTDAITNILNTPVEEDIESVVIPMGMVSDAMISPDMIDRLEGFVQFVDGE